MRRWVAAVAGAGLLVPLLGVTTPAVADVGDRVRVSIQALAPTALTPESTLSVSGRVANAGTEEFTSIGVRLTISPLPLSTRGDISAVADGSPDFDGYALFGTSQEVADDLGPGASAGYRITTRVSQLPLGAAGVYVLGVEAVGISPTLGYIVLGRSRVLLPWVPDPPASPTGLVWLWPLSTWPGRTPDGVLLGTSLPREISDGGRLADVVDAAATAPAAISWVIDPALVQSVAAMPDGYLVLAGDELQPGTAGQAASRWLATLRRSVGDSRGPSVWSLPYADVDADALRRAGLDVDVVRAVTTARTLSRSLLERPVDGTLYWAPGGRVDPRTLDLLASAGIGAVIVHDTTVAPTIPPDYTPTGAVDLDTQFGPIRAIVTDTGLSQALAMPQETRAEIVAARQRFLAETAFIALEDSPLPRTVVAAPAGTRWSPSETFAAGLLTALRTTPWIRMTPVDDLISSSPSTLPRSRDVYGARAIERELPIDYLARIIEAQASLAALRSVVVNPAAITEPIAEALLRSESSSWRTRPAAGNRLVDIIQGDLDRELSGVYVVSRGTVTFSGDTGSVPVTVANDLDEPVVVGLKLTGTPSARLVAEPLADIEIEPGRRASLEVPVRIIGGDPVPVTVSLLDGEGRAFGASGDLELQTTAYARAALWFAIGAAVLLIVLVVFDIVRRNRQRRRSAGITT